MNLRGVIDPDKVRTEDEYTTQGPTFLICNRVSSGPPGVPSDKNVCSNCGEEVWVSKETSPPVLARGAKPLCGECYKERAKPNDALFVTKATRMEANRLFGEGLARELADHIEEKE